ncbi:MAG TPA: class I SAM-dependent methyltransferase [Candidatus Paceibacterota bacterium]
MAIPEKPNACVACGASTIFIRETHDIYTLYECTACDLQFWWPFKNPGSEFYEVDNKESVSRNENPLSMSMLPTQERFLHDKQKQGGSLVDLGMGSGRFIAEAEKIGYTVAGCDFDRDAVKTAQTYYGLSDVHALSVEDFVTSFPDRKFDVVTMFEILEHLDGFDAIPKILSLMKSDGLLVVSTPWRGRWGGFFSGDHPPEHLTRWSDKAIRTFFETRGFRILHMHHMPAAPDYFSRLLMRFPEWTRGWLSFGLSKKLKKKENIASRPANNTLHLPKKTSLRNRIIRALSVAKLYGLFFIPTVVLYAYLSATGGRHATGFYIIMEKA